MKKLAVIVVLGTLAFAAHERSKRTDHVPMAFDSTDSPAPGMEVERSTRTFQCDGRQYCSQMTSCEEAMYFLQNCPNVKMDGDNGGRGDGIPCERQWCGKH